MDIPSKQNGKRFPCGQNRGQDICKWEWNRHDFITQRRKLDVAAQTDTKQQSIGLWHLSHPQGK